MGLFSSVGASSAANEILALVRQKISENSKKPEIIKVLQEIEKEVEEIKKSADAGWY